MPILEALRGQWRRHNWTEPPVAPAKLWGEDSRTVYVEETWGPPIPYPTSDHHDGAQNHGYVRLKGNLPAILNIPEAQDWPELASFLACINADTSPIESVGCEKGYFQLPAGGDARVKLGSYTDVIYSHSPLNDDPHNALALSASLAAALDGCDRWWSSLELGIQRLRWLDGCSTPWGLMIRVGAAGRDKAEARRLWAYSLSLLGAEVSRLPVDFRQGGLHR